MSLSPEERLYIDNYLQGRLSGIELQRFMEKLETDPAFRSKVSMQNLLVDTVVQVADQELRENLINAVDYKKPSVPLGLKLIITFVLIMISGIVIWNMIGYDPQQKRKQLLKLSWLSNSQEGDKAAVEQQDFQQQLQSNSKSQMKSYSKADDINLQLEEIEDMKVTIDSLSPGNEVAGEEFEQLIVKQDQLLIVQTLRIFEDTLYSSYRSDAINETSLSQEVAAKLDPSAGIELLDDRKYTVNSILVEFWISPVNYKGYKFAGDRLIIFGIDEPGEVSLIRADGILYMNYFNEVYILRDVEVYSSLNPVRTKTGQVKPLK